MAEKSRVQLVLRNAAFATVGRGISQVLLGITALVLVRYLGLGLYSEYSTAALFMVLFSVFGRLGFNQVLLRECSRDVSLTPNYFAAALLLNSGLAFLAWLVALTIAYFRYDSRIFTLAVLLGTSQMLISLTRMSSRVFQVHQKLHFTAIVSIAGAVLYTIAIFSAMALKASVFVLAGLHLAMSVFDIVLSYSFSFRLSFPRLNRAILKKLILVGRHFCAINVMLILYAGANGFILAAFNLKEHVGIYNAAFRLFALFNMIGQTISGAISPAIYGASTEPERMIRGLRLAIRYFTVSGLLAGVILVGRADWFITTLFKVEFARSANVLKLLGLAVACRFIFMPFSHVIYAMNKERFMMVLMTCVAIFSVGSCLILVPLYGAIGAGMVFLISEGFVAVVCLIQSERLLVKPGFWKLFILPVLSAVVTLVVLMASGDWPILGLLVSPLIFVGFLWLAGYYRAAEVISFAKMLR